MADIPGNIAKMNDIEIAFDASVSEQLMNKIGANINALVDLAGNIEVFTASGTWTVPENVERVYFAGCGGGGGGGGGGGANAADNRSSGGGAGGAGAAFMLSAPVNVVPTTILTVTIGAGGTGGAGGGTSAPSGTNGFTGNNGASTTVTGFAGDVSTILFPGAEGGEGGKAPQYTASPLDSPLAAGGSQYILTLRDGDPAWTGGDGGHGNAGGVDGSAAPTETSIYGGTIAGAAGGISGSQVGGGRGGGGGGGGASSNFGIGGAGGRGCDNTSSNNTAGSNATATHYGAAGGGGGGGAEAANVAGQPGGDAAPGVLYIIW